MIQSSKIYVSTFDVLVRHNIDIANEVYGRKVMKCGVQGEPDTVVYNTLPNAVGKNGRVVRARSLMNEMSELSDNRSVDICTSQRRKFCSVSGVAGEELCDQGGRLPKQERIKSNEGRIDVVGNRLDAAVDHTNKLEEMFPRAIDRSLRVLDLLEEMKRRFYDQMTKVAVSRVLLSIHVRSMDFASMDLLGKHLS
ncbi:hypothetical protein Ancab_003072 [Ancistrocladus abbreviatus]